MVFSLMKTRSAQAGFTLIELLVVVSIVGLLSTMATVSLQEARVKARDVRRLADVRQIQTALEFYAADSAGNIYPSGTDISLGTTNYACLNASGFVSRPCSSPYMGLVPLDPGSGSYLYRQLNSGGRYQITFSLETNVSATLGAGAHIATPDGIQ